MRVDRLDAVAPRGSQGKQWWTPTKNAEARRLVDGPRCEAMAAKGKARREGAPGLLLLPRLLAAILEGKGEVEDHAAHRNAEGEFVGTFVAGKPHNTGGVLLCFHDDGFQRDAFDVDGLGAFEHSGTPRGERHVRTHVIAGEIRAAAGFRR